MTPHLALALCAVFLAPAAARSAAGRPATTSPSAVLTRADARIAQNGGGGIPAARGEGGDRTLAPYFVVAGGDDSTERLPLEETSADIQVAGVIAQVKVHQIFKNDGAKPIEATYVFPASTRAAVHAMRMRIGERTIEARIDKRAEARAAYEQAKREGKRASLLEQERPNVFTMSVANVMPKDRIEVELEYSELLVPTDATYELVYPAVVGPRYGGGADPAKDGWIQSPYLHQGEKEPYRFGVKVHLETGIPLKEVSSPSHEITVSYGSPNRADVNLAQPGGGTRDFVLRYRLAGDRIETGALVYEGSGERFFLLMLEPPARPTTAQIPPREYVFLLDVSGSMNGFPLDTAKSLMRNLLGALRPSDLFDVVLFAGGSAVMSPQGSIPATPANIQRALSMIDREQGGGGTELLAGLRAAYGVPAPRSPVARTVVVVTDGYVGVEAQAFALVRERLGEANTFAFGIGGSVNRGLIEGLARAGLGEPFVVARPDAAAAAAAKLQEYIQYPVLTDIQVRFDGLDAREVAPSKIPDLLARRPLVVYGKLPPGAAGAVEVRGVTGGGPVTQRVTIAASDSKPENAAIRFLWARKWVEVLDDEMAMAPAPEIEEAITDLGLSYTLLTKFTSFVAVDSQVVNQGGQGVNVKQPLPLPEGVSDLAVGGPSLAAAPSPAYGSGAMRAKSAPSLGILGGGGAGGGNVGRLTSVGSAPAASPAEVLREAKAAPKRAAEHEAAADEAAGIRASTRVTVVTSSGVSSPIGVRAVVTTAAASACPVTVKLTLIVKVDDKGRVISVEARETTAGQALACLRRMLVGKSTTTLAKAGVGTVELLVEPAT